MRHPNIARTVIRTSVPSEAREPSEADRRAKEQMILIRSGKISVARVFVALFAALLAAFAARAQDAPMGAAAKQIADAISHSKQKSVIVFDFSGPDDKLTTLGQKLAEDFSAELEKSGEPFQVENRSRITEGIAQNQFELESLTEARAVLEFAQHLQVQAYVMGQLSIDHDKLRVVVSCYRTSNGKSIKSASVAWPLTDEMKAQMQKDLLETASEGDLASYPAPGKNGLSYPRCVYCPHAQYSPEAMNAKIQGVVMLEVVVGVDGRVHNILVKKGLPYGLTASAIRTVKTWRLTPAIGPDGKPTAVRQIIEATFQFF
jgi:TonB family protein